MTTPSDLFTTRNDQAVAFDQIPRHDMATFQRIARQTIRDGQRVSAFFGRPPRAPGGLDLILVLANDATSQINLLSTQVDGDSFPSLTPDCPSFHLFEREIFEQFNVRPDGHPWLKPVRYPEADSVPGGGDFYKIEGDEIHEVAVGPIHAGIIEPGHFRFQCHGEIIYHLEIALGYQHRGIEKAMVSQPTNRRLHYAENIAGDTAIGHGTAYCHLIESLSGNTQTVRAQAIRAIALELERLANHIGDIGALSGDVGFLPTASYCGRIRGDFLNMTALLCGSRFGRGLLRPGGVEYDLTDAQIADFRKRLDAGEADTTSAIELFFNTPSVLARLDGKGVLPADICHTLGVVGPAARASGLARDVRHSQPAGIYRFVQLPLSTWDSCDAFSRAYVRWLEIKHSIAFIREQLQALPTGAVQAPIGPLKPNHLAVSLVEGWRGELCHVALTDDTGTLQHYKIVDPSFHNWMGLAYALRNEEISDFPLCNKSFCLSYCGHDL